MVNDRGKRGGRVIAKGGRNGARGEIVVKLVSDTNSSIEDNLSHRLSGRQTYQRCIQQTVLVYNEYE